MCSRAFLCLHKRLSPWALAVGGAICLPYGWNLYGDGNIANNPTQAMPG
jgi:hypothetical protein